MRQFWWAVFRRRVVQQVKSLVYYSISVAIFFIISGSLIALTINSDPATRVLAGFWLTVFIWFAADLLGAAILLSPDNVLFDLTPLTLARYLRRRFQRVWLATCALLLAAPVIAYLMMIAAHPDVPDRWNPLMFVSALLAYYTLMLNPMAESLSGRRRLTVVLFPPRFFLDRYFGVVLLIVIAGFALDWLTSGSIERLSYSIAETLLDLRGIGLVILALISPASAVLVQDAPGMPTYGGWLLVLFFGLLLGRQLWQVAAALTRPIPHWEQEDFEHWLEHRREVEAQHEDWAEREASVLDEWACSMHTWEKDAGEPSPDRGLLNYDDESTTERQMVRHLRYFGGPPRTHPRYLYLPLLALNQHFWLAVTLMLWVLWLASGKGAWLAGYLVPASIIFALASGLLAAWWWLTELRWCVGLPVRLSALVRRFVAWKYCANIVADALVAALVGQAFEWSVLSTIAFFIAVQLLRISAYLGVWLVVLGEGGRRWATRAFWYSFVIVAGVLFLLLYIRTTEQNQSEALVSVFDGYVVGLPLGLFFLAGLLLIVAQRGADSSLLRLSEKHYV